MQHKYKVVLINVNCFSS